VERECLKRLVMLIFMLFIVFDSTLTLARGQECTEATVYVQPQDTYIVWIINGTGQTVAGPQVSDGSGDFTACLENGTYIACAQPAVGDPECVGFTVPDDTSVTITFCYEVTVHVQDSCGNLVYPSVVEVYNQTGNLVSSGDVDTNGDYGICLENGWYFAQAWEQHGDSEVSDAFHVPDTKYVTITFYENCFKPVGGISIPVNKLELLAPYIGLTILLAVAVALVVYVKKRKRHTRLNS
jgi:hypothetical protein